MSRRFQRVFLGCILALLSGLTAAGQERPGPDQPLWRFDLHSVGYTAYVPPQLLAITGISSGDLPGHTELTFSDDHTLIADFIEPNRTPALARRGQVDDTLAYVLHAVVLDTGDGSAKAKHEWPVEHPSAGIVGVGAGNYVVLTPSAITLYSPDFSVIGQAKQSDLPADKEKWLSGEYAVSPGGKLLLARYVWQPNEATAHVAWRWFELPSFRQLHWYNDDASPVEVHEKRQKFTGTLTFTDGQVAISRQESRVCSVLLSDWGGSWKTLAQAPSNGRGCERPQFVGHGLLALISQDAFRVIRTSTGETLCMRSFWPKLRLSPYPAPLRVSLTGNRLAVPVWEYKPASGRGHPLAGYSLNAVLVYDLDSGKCIHTLHLGGSSSSKISAIALSPDGSLVAFVNSGVIEVYRIP